MMHANLPRGCNRVRVVGAASVNSAYMGSLTIARCSKLSFPASLPRSCSFDVDDKGRTKHPQGPSAASAPVQAITQRVLPAHLVLSLQLRLGLLQGTTR
jgi:hypothetical protein